MNKRKVKKILKKEVRLRIKMMYNRGNHEKVIIRAIVDVYHNFLKNNHLYDFYITRYGHMICYVKCDFEIISFPLQEDLDE